MLQAHLDVSNLLLKEISNYILEILARVGNDILFNYVPLPDKWFMHRKVVLIKKTQKGPPPSISLLENTYKLYSIALSNRMKKATEHIQGAEQHGFTTG